MESMTLGRTGLTVGRLGFGALPIQRISREESRTILLKALEAGVTFFDTARYYTDSEEKLGFAFAGKRDQVVIATKTGGKDRQAVEKELEESLRLLKTDYIDIYQHHNPAEIPDSNDENSPLAAMRDARKAGKVRFIGLTNHRLKVAREAVDSGFYDTVQFPLSLISSEEEFDFVEQCRKANVAFIAMKALCGGLVANIPAAFTFLRQFDNVIPIYGVQRLSELEELLVLEEASPGMDAELWAAVEQEREALSGDFCRACGYCLPCPEEIPIPMAARMTYLLGRAPWQAFVTEEWQEKMGRILNCRDCGLCKSRCPYELETPQLLKKMVEDYTAFLEQKRAEGMLDQP